MDALHWLESAWRIGVFVLVRVCAACTVLTLAMRTVPERRFTAFERAYPRCGHAARAVRKLALDFIPFVLSVVAAMRGAPPREPPAPRHRRADVRQPAPPPTSTHMRLALVAALLAGCSGSWEQRAHRGIILTAHVAAVADDTAATVYRVNVATLPPGAEYDRQRAVFAIVRDAEHALNGALVRAETLVDAIEDAGGDPATARCLAVHALVQLATDVATLRDVFATAGITVPTGALDAEQRVGAVVLELLPSCGPVATDGGTHE